MLRNKKGQSLLEYILILTVIVVAIIAARQLLSNRVGSLINDTAVGAINSSAGNFTNMTEAPVLPQGGVLPTIEIANVTP